MKKNMKRNSRKFLVREKIFPGKKLSRKRTVLGSETGEV
jgi:hypothetical protein